MALGRLSLFALLTERKEPDTGVKKVFAPRKPGSLGSQSGLASPWGNRFLSCYSELS